MPGIRTSSTTRSGWTSVTLASASGAVPGGDDLETFQPQVDLHEAEDVGVVVGHEHGSSQHTPSLSWRSGGSLRANHPGGCTRDQPIPTAWRPSHPQPGTRRTQGHNRPYGWAEAWLALAGLAAQPLPHRPGRSRVGPTRWPIGSAASAPPPTS